MLICPKCKEELKKVQNGNGFSYVCNNHHTYDIAKSGYVNLLLNVSTSGDNKEMVESRAKFLNKDYYLPLALKISEVINSFKIDNINILDIGCGEGYYDRIIHNNTKSSIIGLDISKDAITKASKTSNKDINFIVANSYHLPIINKGIDVSLSIFSPIDIDEIKRVTKNYFIKVIPNDKHLLELKEDLYKEVYLNEVKENINLKLFKRETIEYKTKVLDMDDLFKMTPYYYTTHNNYDLHLESKEVTFSFIIDVYEIGE